MPRSTWLRGIEKRGDQFSIRQLHCFFLVLVVGSSALLPVRFHPREQWKEYRRGSVIVVYPRGYEANARKLIKRAVHQYRRVSEYWGDEARDPVRILLNPFTDAPSGRATFYPHNFVEVSLYPAPPDRAIGGYRSWMDFVLSHELTHVITLNMASPAIGGLRRFFGHHPLLFPLAAAPTWLIEGLAVLAESDLQKGSGRLCTPDYAIMLGQLKNRGKIPPLKRIYGDYLYWPYGKTPYLLGGGFLQFLRDTYGREKLISFVHFYSRYVMALYWNQSFLQVFNGEFLLWKDHYLRPVFRLWKDFIQSIGDPGQPGDSDCFQILTRSGGEKSYPFVTPAGDIGYYRRNYRDKRAVVLRDKKSGGERVLFGHFPVNGLVGPGGTGSRFYFSAIQTRHGYYSYSDIYRYEGRGKRVERLTRGRRLLSPVEDGSGGIFCVCRADGGARLARYDPENRQLKILSEKFESLDHLALSPDGRTIAASVKMKGRKWSVGLFHGKGDFLRLVSTAGFKAYWPRWQSREVLFHIQEHRGDYVLASFHLKKGSRLCYPDPRIPPLKYFDFFPASPERMAVVFYNHRGYDLGVLDLSKIRASSVPPLPSSPAVSDSAGEESIPGVMGGKNYQRGRDLFPHVLTPFGRFGGREFQPGMYLEGEDVTGNHRYKLQMTGGWSSKSLNLDASYRFPLIYPFFTLSVRDQTDTHLLSRGVHYRTRDMILRLRGKIPLIRTPRREIYLFGGVHRGKVETHYSKAIPRRDYHTGGYGVGLYFYSAKTYYDSISPADGFSISLSLSRESRGWGSDADYLVGMAEIRRYISLFRPGVLALRSGLVAGNGKEKGPLLLMGGNAPQPVMNRAGANIFSLLRGYPSGFFSGTAGFLFNAEYRLPVAKLGQKFFIVTSFERLYVTFFLEGGQVGLKPFSSPLSISAGMEWNLTAYLFGRRMQVALGCAKGFNPSSPPRLYVRLGRSF